MAKKRGKTSKIMGELPPYPPPPRGAAHCPQDTRIDSACISCTIDVTTLILLMRKVNLNYDCDGDVHDKRTQQNPGSGI